MNATRLGRTRPFASVVRILFTLALVAAGVVPARAGGEPEELNPRPVWSVRGLSADDRLGTAVATAGDVNGDGYSDFIVGAPGRDGVTPDRGQVTLYLGGPVNPVPTPWQPLGESNGSNFGLSVAPAGDVNGDGYGDVIVGAPTHYKVYVYHGSFDGLSAEPAVIIVDTFPGGQFGSAVGTAGDVNNDGFADVIVGAPSVPFGGQSFQGVARIFLGSASGLLTVPDTTLSAGTADSYFGSSVATAGDVNADGYADVIVGAPSDGGQSTVPQGHVYLGGPQGIASGPLTLSGALGSQFGHSVFTAGDVNLDGRADVIVGAPGQFSPQFGSNSGWAGVYAGTASGIAAAPLWSREGLGGDRLGAVVSTAGDYNADGYADILVSSPLSNDEATDAGTILIFTKVALPGGAAEVGTQIRGGIQNLQWGSAVAAAGDVNGDGFGDILGGTPLYSQGVASRGIAALYRGSAAVPPLTESLRLQSNLANARFGESIAAAGDFNADGFSDLLVGSPGESNGQAGEGRVYVYPGGSGGLNGATPFVLESNFAGFGLGNSVAAAGDVNGDGFGDVILGANAATESFFKQGYVALCYGGAVGPPSFIWNYAGSVEQAQLGTSVAGAGDVNGDGYADVIVGAPGHIAPGVHGRAYLFYGSAAGLPPLPSRVLSGYAPGGEFGASVAGAGDVNRDGFSDVVIGAPGAFDKFTDEGSAYLFLGSATGVDTVWDFRVQGSALGYRLGESVSTAGDVNGDGYSDILIGVPHYSNDHADEGEIRLYLGSATLPLGPPIRIEPNIAGSLLGTRVAAAGDVDGDGYGDVLAGAPGETASIVGGRAYLYRGTPSGNLSLTSWFPTGGQLNGKFGLGLAGRGDYNGDGFSDLAVGGPGMSDGQSGEGLAFVHYANGGQSKPRWCKQTVFGSVNPTIDLLGRATHVDRFQVRVLVPSPAGRTRVGYHVQAAPLGSAFPELRPITRPTFMSGTPSSEGSRLIFGTPVSNLNDSNLYHWRVRGLTSSPYFPWGPWLSLPMNAVTESDVRLLGTQAVGVIDGGARGMFLDAAQPNPFRETTSFAFVLSEATRARLSVHDAAGRHVATLVDKDLPAGDHRGAWDGRSHSGRRVAAGVYFARLETFSGVATGRVVLLP